MEHHSLAVGVVIFAANAGGVDEVLWGNGERRLRSEREVNVSTQTKPTRCFSKTTRRSEVRNAVEDAGSPFEMKAVIVLFSNSQ